MALLSWSCHSPVLFALCFSPVFLPQPASTPALHQTQPRSQCFPQPISFYLLFLPIHLSPISSLVHLPVSVIHSLPVRLCYSVVPVVSHFVFLSVICSCCCLWFGPLSYAVYGLDPCLFGPASFWTSKPLWFLKAFFGSICAAQCLHLVCIILSIKKYLSSIFLIYIYIESISSIYLVQVFIILTFGNENNICICVNQG